MQISAEIHRTQISYRTTQRYLNTYNSPTLSLPNILKNGSGGKLNLRHEANHYHTVPRSAVFKRQVL
jgi:hypothetical protein